MERCNGNMHDELLNGEEFDSRGRDGGVGQRDTTLRPRRGLGMMTPNQLAASWKDGVN